MAKPNYDFAKRQRELAKKQKQEAKRNKKLAEKSLIRCVLYADGTTWREANTSEDVCNLLRKGKAGVGRKH